MDWLRCFNLRLVGYHSPIRNYVTSNGLRVKLSYNDCRSLAIKVIKARRMPNMAETGSVYGTTPVLCGVIIVCPLNTGIFVSGVVSNEACMAVAMVTGLTAKVLIRAV